MYLELKTLSWSLATQNVARRPEDWHCLRAYGKCTISSPPAALSFRQGTRLFQAHYTLRITGLEYGEP